MANQFSVEPVNIAQGIQALNTGVQRRAGFERERVKEAKVENIRNQAAQLMADPNATPEQIQEFRIKHPEASQVIKDSYEFKSKRTESSKKETLLRVIMGEVEPAAGLLEHGEIIDQEGGKADETIGDVKTALINPEEAKRKALIEYASLATPAEYKQVREAMGGGVDKKGKPLKLTQLITKRNGLPEGSPDIEIYEQAIKKEIAMPGQAKTHPFISKLMAEGWMPSGRITGPMLSAFEAAAEKANEMGKPLTVTDLRNMEFQAVKNRSTGSSAGSRLVVGRKQNIEAAQGLLKDLKKTSAKLNYSPVRFIASLEKWKKKETVDPLFTEYMTQRADSLFVLGNALKQNGLTDKSIEVEEEAFAPTLSPKAFDGWYNTQVRALNRAASEMNKDYGYGITLMPAFDAGQAGAPTKEQPNPVMPGGAGGRNLQDYIKKAKELNPGTTDQEITDFYNKTYGGQ